MLEQLERVRAHCVAARSGQLLEPTYQRDVPVKNNLSEALPTHYVVTTVENEKLLKSG